MIYKQLARDCFLCNCFQFPAFSPPPLSRTPIIRRGKTGIFARRVAARDDDYCCISGSEVNLFKEPTLRLATFKQVCLFARCLTLHGVAPLSPIIKICFLILADLPVLTASISFYFHRNKRPLLATISRHANVSDKTRQNPTNFEIFEKFRESKENNNL